MIKRDIILFAALLAIILGVPAFAQSDVEHRHHGVGSVLASVASEELRGITASFELLDGDGNLVTDEDFRGQYVLLAFGFTHCEQICPLMAFNMGNVLRATEQNAVGIFVSVDTERDTPAVTDIYASAFGDRMIGLGGTYEQINTVASNFGVSYAVTKTQRNYTVQHTANIYLMNPDGELQDIFSVTASSEEILSAIR